MSSNESSIKFIHWDYTPENIGEMLKDRSYFELHIGALRDSETNLPTGFYFLWKCKLHSKQGEYLNCIGQDVFRHGSTKDLNPETIVFSAKKSHIDFNNALNERLDIIDHPVYLPYRSLSLEKAQEFLEEVNKK